MIQDIIPDILKIEYKQKIITNDCIVFCFKEGKVLCNTGGTLVFPERRLLECSEYTYLFNVSGVNYFLAKYGVEKIPDGYTFEETSIFRSLLTKKDAFAGLTALHLNNWYEANQYCGRCRDVMEHDEKERMVKCKSCKKPVYPKISPVIIVGVTNGNKLLMTRYAGSGYRRYALVAGFMEIGESAEDAVRREVFEETGIKVKNIRYYKSQPWGFSESLLFGFYAELDGADVLTIDYNELSEAVWVNKEDIETEYDDYSLTNELICHFKGIV